MIKEHQHRSGDTLKEKIVLIQIKMESSIILQPRPGCGDKQSAPLVKKATPGGKVGWVHTLPCGP